MDKKSRKELLKQDDAFLAAAGQSAVWVTHHRKLVVGGTLAIVLAVGTVWGGIEWVSTRDQKASELFASATEITDAKIVAAGETADPTAKPPTFASEEERKKAARDAFQQVVDAASSSGVADMARFYVADLDAQLGESDKALASFATLEHRLSADDSLYFLAVERTAYLQEQKGDKDAAVKTWQQLLGSNKRFYADHALYELGRLYVERGDNDKARELLTRIEKDFPGSSVLGEAQQLLAQVGPAPAGDAKAEAKAEAKEPKATP